MKSVKYSTKDWKCAAFNLVGVTEQPKSKQLVDTRCGKCGLVRQMPLAEVARNASRQSRHTDVLLCKSCYAATPGSKQERAAASARAAARPEVRARAAAASRRLWEDPNYRNNHGIVVNGQSDATKAKLSAAMKAKFRGDEQYVAKIREARLKYWDNPGYRTPREWDAARFVAAAREVHGDRYDYSQIEYLGFRTKIGIICKTHGLFAQLPGHHIHFGNGCPRCAAELTVSAGETEVADWISGLGFAVERSNRILLGGMELDIFLPDRRLAVEYNGLYWHSNNGRESGPQRYRHHYKATLAEAAGIRLLQFNDLEWRDNMAVVQSMIANRLGLSTRVFARNCRPDRLAEPVAAEFFSRNHLAGHRPAAHYYGLMLDERPVCVISLSEIGSGGYEIIRFATAAGLVVVGGLSRLLAVAGRELGFRRLFTYADRRHANGAGYIAAGFRHLGITPPGYKYFKHGVLYSRQKFQKHKLATLLPSFDPSRTESENMYDNGYRKVWDAGHHRFELDNTGDGS